MSTRRSRGEGRAFPRTEQQAPARLLYLDRLRRRGIAAPEREQIEFALEAARVGTWTSDLITGELTWDEGNYRLFGRVPGDFSGDSIGFMALVHPDDRCRVRAALRRANESGSFDVEFRVVWADGTVHVLAGRGKLARDADGRAVKLVGANWDVTERWRAEEALRSRQTFINRIGRLSNELITANDEDLEHLTQETLEHLGEFTGVDRVHLLLSSEDGSTIAPSHSWAADKAADVHRRSTLDWALYLQRLGGAIRLRRLAELPAAASPVRALLQADGIDGLLALPLGPAGRPVGLVTFECIGRSHEWRDEDVELLRAASEMLTHTMERRRTAADLKRRLKLDQVLSAISSSLLNLPDGAFEEGVSDALGLIADFVGADRASLAIFTQGGARCEVTHVWPRPEPGVPNRVRATADLPWMYGRFEREMLVTVTDTEQMPPEAAADRRVLSGLGIRSIATVALVREETPFGLVSAIGRAPRAQWRHEEALLMRMAGEMILVEIRRRQEAYASATLARVGQDLVRLADSSTVAERICQLVTETVRSDACLLLMHQEGTSRYRPLAQHGLSEAEWNRISVLRFDYEPAEADLEGGASLEGAHGRFAASVLEEIQRRSELRGGTCVPLTSGSGLIGALVACTRQPGDDPGEAQIDLLRRISQMAAFGLANARLFGELEQANRVKTDFIATMSHELRTPLNIILGYSDLLIEEMFGPLNDEQRGAVARVVKSGHGLLELIEATLNVAHLDAGRAVLELSEVDVSILLADLLSELKRDLEKPEVALCWDVPTQLPRLHTDAGKLKLVLRNVIENGLKFTREGYVHVSAVEHDEGIAFNVEDTGVGIAPEAQSVIFESFRQGDQSMTREFGGIGLGLYLVRRTLDLLGGSISVASVVGTGSRFTIWLPTTAEREGS